MSRFSTREAAKRLGISYDTLAHYVEVGKVPTPEIIRVGTGSRVVHAWSETEIEHVRQLLPKIANGRKTRYKKKQSAVSTQQSAKTKKKTQARAPALQTQKKKK
jgi:hypothetical protein